MTSMATSIAGDKARNGALPERWEWRPKRDELEELGLVPGGGVVKVMDPIWLRRMPRPYYITLASVSSAVRVFKRSEGVS